MLSVESSLRHRLEQWGYVSLPPTHEHSPGFPGVLVLLRENAAANVFIPRSLTVRLRQPQQKAEWHTLTTHNTSLDTPQTLCPSHITLQDQHGQKTVFFAYGGLLDAANSPNEAVYTIHSSAPILHVSDTIPSTGDQLAAESEALMAELEAQLNISETVLQAKLSELDPMHLYLWCLDRILTRYQANAHLRQASVGFFHDLERERDWLIDHGQWPESPPTLDEWLA